MLAAGSLREALAVPARAAFERLLAPFLRRQRWFGRKSRVIASVSVSDFADLFDVGAALLLLDVRYAEGDRESFFVPLVHVLHGSHAGHARQVPRFFAGHLSRAARAPFSTPRWTTVSASGCSA